MYINCNKYFFLISTDQLSPEFPIKFWTLVGDDRGVDLIVDTDPDEAVFFPQK